MVNLALEALHIKASVEVHIEKRLPVQGGLGAGSANAVAALVGLEAELGIEADGSGLPPFEQKAFEGWGSHIRWSARRLEIAAQVGSDVPLFLIGGSVLGLDRGPGGLPPSRHRTLVVRGSYVPRWEFLPRRRFAIGINSVLLRV